MDPIRTTPPRDSEGAFSQAVFNKTITDCVDDLETGTAMNTTLVRLKGIVKLLLFSLRNNSIYPEGSFTTRLALRIHELTENEKGEEISVLSEKVRSALQSSINATPDSEDTLTSVAPLINILEQETLKKLRSNHPNIRISSDSDVELALTKIFSENDLPASPNWRNMLQTKSTATGSQFLTTLSGIHQKIPQVTLPERDSFCSSLTHRGKLILGSQDLFKEDPYERKTPEHSTPNRNLNVSRRDNPPLLKSPHFSHHPQRVPDTSGTTKQLIEKAKRALLDQGVRDMTLMMQIEQRFKDNDFSGVGLDDLLELQTIQDKFSEQINENIAKAIDTKLNGSDVVVQQETICDLLKRHFEQNSSPESRKTGEEAILNKLSSDPEQNAVSLSALMEAVNETTVPKTSPIQKPLIDLIIKKIQMHDFESCTLAQLNHLLTIEKIEISEENKNAIKRAIENDLRNYSIERLLILSETFRNCAISDLIRKAIDNCLSSPEGPE